MNTTTTTAPALPLIVSLGICVTVRYHGPTLTRGGRWTASIDNGHGRKPTRLTVYCQHDGKDWTNRLTLATACLRKWEQSLEGPFPPLQIGAHGYDSGAHLYFVVIA